MPDLLSTSYSVELTASCCHTKDWSRICYQPSIFIADALPYACPQHLRYEKPSLRRDEHTVQHPALQYYRRLRNARRSYLLRRLARQTRLRQLGHTFGGTHINLVK